MKNKDDELESRATSAAMSILKGGKSSGKKPKKAARANNSAYFHNLGILYILLVWQLVGVVWLFIGYESAYSYYKEGNSGSEYFGMLAFFYYMVLVALPVFIGFLLLGAMHLRVNKKFRKRPKYILESRLLLIGWLIWLAAPFAVPYLASWLADLL